MSNETSTANEETRLAEHLVARVCDRALGRTDDECLRNYPRDVYFIGNLRPSQEAPEPRPDEPGYLRELINKLAPMAFGAEFLLGQTRNSETIEVGVTWACYYRVFPTLLQQRQQQIVGQGQDQSGQAEDAPAANGEDPEVEAPQNGEDADAAEPPPPPRRRRIQADSLFLRFKKITCSATGRVQLTPSADGQWKFNLAELQENLDREMERAMGIAQVDPERIRTPAGDEDNIRVQATALASEDSYRAFVSSLTTERFPRWRWQLHAEMRSTEMFDAQASMLTIEFVNVSPMPPNSTITEAFLFDCHAKFLFPRGVVRPFQMDLAPRSFRFDRNVWGRGLNCAVERAPDSPTQFWTTHTPVVRQMRLVTRTVPSASFADLADDPLPTLNAILTAMEKYRQNWEEARRTYAAEAGWEAAFGAEFDRDRQQYESEIAQFQRGIELIRHNADVRLAFRLTNETFRRGPRPSWRLFQIVFIVSQLPGIAALANSAQPSTEREMVDVIYFPTGGGKTEAYLGTIVFHCFFDRLRGKAAGVTAWTRFPLRLLTLQQTQRVADVIGIADLVRRQQEDARLSGPGVDQFAVGYFVGAEATPNELINPANYNTQYMKPADATNWSIAIDPTGRQRWRRVTNCPSCRTPSVQVDFDQAAVSLLHRCNRPNCAFPGGLIPVYVVDNEIFRHLPSVIVGTIDKLASLGNQRKMALIFGQVDGSCTAHGYYKGKCCQKECKDQSQLQPRVPRGLTGPTLFVQDELHLLKEGLGTFDAHYESFTQKLEQEFGQTKPIKIIASSATIEAFSRQVEHLYARAQANARIFPGPGPTLGDSFYAETRDYPQRLLVGIIPHNKTIFNTILELIEIYHRETQGLQRLSQGTLNPYGGILPPGTPQWQAMLDLYITSLTYFLSGRELNSIRTDINGDTNPNLQRDGSLPLDILELTSNTSTDDVTRILDHLQRMAQPNTIADAVLATSMVSHGVDVDRFNAMIFYGMPRQTAEYIQASSRVGRAHVGIVFTCLHPARERDQSHYAYFAKYHEFIGQMVEPVAINRWARFSIDRTLPGLFMAVLLQVIANRSGGRNVNQFYMLDFLRQQISSGSLRADDFIPFLEEAYGVNVTPPTPERQAFRAEIRRRIPQFLDQIISAGPNSKFVSGVLIPQPLTSLREVDEPVKIELDRLGSVWAET